MDNMPFPAAFIDDIPQICVLCGIYFNNALSLQYHMRLHAAPTDPTTMFDARPPPVLPSPTPTTTSSPTNGSVSSSVNVSSQISPVSPTTTMPKQDFELGLEFLNSLTQMYANPSASREIKEKGYDFRYEPNTSNQTSSGASDIPKPTDTLKYNFDDFYNSPGADELDKKFESVLNYELSKDNGLHFDNHEKPLESILDDEPLTEKEKPETLVDSVSQMYQNELRKELDSISNDSKLESVSNDSMKNDDQNNLPNLKVPNIPEPPKLRENSAHSSNVTDKSVSKSSNEKVSQENNPAEDSQSFEDEIATKVGKFSKIKKYFQSQEMRKKERSSVEKSETSTNILPNGEKTDKSKSSVDNVKTIIPVTNKKDNVFNSKSQNLSVSKETKKTVVKGKVEKNTTAKDDKKETSEKVELGISVRSLRKRPTKEPEQKKQNPKKKANQKKVIGKEKIEAMLNEMKSNSSEKNQKDQEPKENTNVEEKKETPAKEKETENDLKTKEMEMELKKNETGESKPQSPIVENEVKEDSVVVRIKSAEKDNMKSPEKIIAPETNADFSPVVSIDENKINANKDKSENTVSKTLNNAGTESVNNEVSETQNDSVSNTMNNSATETQNNSGVTESKHITADVVKTDSEATENEDSEGLGFYGQESVEPLKIKIWKIKRHKKKKRKKKKRKKDREERSSTESLSLEGYTEITEKTSTEMANTALKLKLKRGKRFHEKKHACDYCGQAFGQRSDLRKHIMIHTGERPYTCETCEKTFQRKTDLVKHTRIHTGEKPYECEFCGKCVSDKSQLNVHRRLHTGDRPYTCDICQKGCITSSELTRHRQSHFTDRPWKCEVCEKAFKMKECLAMHMKIHNGTKKYQCSKCGLAFDRESKMEQHMLLHETDSQFLCRECGLEFETSSQYADHVRSHKSGQNTGPWCCDYCGKLYEYKSNMETHQRSHGGDRPFICELCNSAYALKGNLKHHMKIQHSDLSYKCHVCSLTFHLKRDLVNHSRTHPDDQLHCFYCDSHFWDEEAAVKHHAECSAKNSAENDTTETPAMSNILDETDDEFAKNFTPQGKIESPPPTRDKKELDKIYDFDDSDSEVKPKRAKVKAGGRRDAHHASPRHRGDMHMSPRHKDLHMSPRNRDHYSPKGPSYSPKRANVSPKGVLPRGTKRSRDPEPPKAVEPSKALTITALLNSPPMNKKPKPIPIPQPKVGKLDLFQGLLDSDKSAAISNTVKEDDLDLLHRQIDATVPDTLPNLTVSDKTDLFENIIDSTDLGQSKDNTTVPFSVSLTSTTESSVFSSKDTIDSLLSTAPGLSEQHSDLPENPVDLPTDLPVTSNTNESPEDRNFAPTYNWKNDLMPSMDYVNSLLMKSLNGPSSMTSGDADDSLSKFNLDYLNPLIMKTLNPDLKFDTNENLNKSNSFYTASSQSSNVFHSPPSAGLPSSNVFSPTSVPNASVFSPTTLPSAGIFSPTSLPSVSVFSSTSVASGSVFTTSTTSSTNLFSPPIGSYSYKSQFSSPSDTRVDTYPTTDYSSSFSRTLGMPNIEKLAMDYLYQNAVASEKEFQQKFGLTGKTDASVPLPSFNYLNSMASNQDMLHDPLDMSAFSGLPSMSAFSRNPDFNAHLAGPSAYGSLDISKTLPSGEKLDDTAALLSNFEYNS